MADIVDSKTRSRMMSGIRSKDTQPEVLIRKLLHSRGFRFRLHVRRLPGKPDIVLKKHRAVIFVHGCFWHQHHCRLFRWPSTRPEFWKAKLGRNCEIDARAIRELQSQGWRTCIIWECSVKNRLSDLDGVTDRISSWLLSSSASLEISK